MQSGNRLEMRFKMWMIFFWAAVGIFSALVIYGYLSNFFPKKEYYTVETDRVDKNCRIVLLTDLHGNIFGEDNEKLLRMIREEKPDVIAVAGDLIVKNGQGTDVALHLLEVLASEYPVYYAPGNHEIRMPEYEAYKEKVRARGVCYLENSSVQDKSGLCFTGLDLPLSWYHKIYEKRTFTLEDLQKILPAPDDPYPVLLAHDPEYFPLYAGWGAGVVLSGHVHGGIARLPVVGGVLAPSLRPFPKYDAGLFRTGRSVMILSRGLGLHHIKLRFFNRPELSIIDILTKKG